MDHFGKYDSVTEEGLLLEYQQIESQLLSFRDENGDLILIVDEDPNSGIIIPYYKNYLLSLITDYCSIVWLAFLARILHFIIDQIKPNSKLKDLITCTTGLLQLNCFTNKVGIDNYGRALTLSVIITYFTYTKYVNLLCKTQKLKHEEKVGNRWPQPFISPMVILTPILINEYFIHVKLLRTNTLLRSILMTLAMKATCQLSSPITGNLSILAYFLHPASCIFGPWHVHLIDLELVNRVSFITLKQQIAKSAKILIQTILILLISDCWLDHIIDRLEYYQESSKLWLPLIIFLRAQQFRCSHYSMCYLTFSLLSLWRDPKDESKICDALRVEWPRSLVQVVVSWNIPMHSWLKVYVFQPSKSYFNSAPLAILLTYLVSSILHGFKFHICAVLLSLGLLTLVEFRFRNKLARQFNACIQAKSCKILPDGHCIAHHTNARPLLVKLVNLVFSAMAILHLSYLGYIFQGDTDQAKYTDALNAWKSLYYYSPILGLTTFIMNSFFNA